MQAMQTFKRPLPHRVLTLVNGARDDEHHVVNHVTIGAQVQERGKGLHRLQIGQKRCLKLGACAIVIATCTRCKEQNGGCTGLKHQHPAQTIANTNAPKADCYPNSSP